MLFGAGTGGYPTSHIPGERPRRAPHRGRLYELVPPGGEPASGGRRRGRSPVLVLPRRGASRLGRRPSDVEAVLLAHGHFDHIGFAERARTALGVPVWVHENDVPLTRHPLQYAHERSRLPYLARPRALPIIAALTRARAFWPRPIAEVRRFTEGVLPVPGSPRVVFTPGHTLGHCALHLADRDAVIAGDALVTLNIYTGERGPRIVAGAATADSERALCSLDPLAETGASILLPGHGEPWTEGSAAAAARAREAGPS